MQTYSLTVGFHEGEEDEFKATLDMNDGGPIMHYGSNDIHTLMAAVGRDIAAYIEKGQLPYNE